PFWGPTDFGVRRPRVGVAVKPCLAAPHAAAALASLEANGPLLIRCTVPGLTPNRAAILRTPSVRPGLCRAARMRRSVLANSEPSDPCATKVACGRLSEAPVAG